MVNYGFALGKNALGKKGKKSLETMAEESNKTSRKWFYYVKKGRELPWFDEPVWVFSRRKK